MRLWSLHPRYLDAKGLVALWREGLLAQAVLAGETRGYRHHPQLHRFREQRDPLDAVARYLREVHREATVRGYRFDASKLRSARGRRRIPVTRGQLRYEREHLLAKLVARDPERVGSVPGPRSVAVHPLFELVAGPIEDWERT